MESPKPVPLPVSFVVKERLEDVRKSVTSIPMPVSLTASMTCGPGFAPKCWRAVRGIEIDVGVSMTSFPPPGMASRELMARFMSTWLQLSGICLHTPTGGLRALIVNQYLSRSRGAASFQFPNGSVEVEKPSARSPVALKAISCMVRGRLVGGVSCGFHALRNRSFALFVDLDVAVPR